MNRAVLPVCLSASSDITESKRAAELSDAMFEMASSPMILLDRHCRICRFNGYAEETFGYAKEEVIGQNIKVQHRVMLGGEAYGYTDRGMTATFLCASQPWPCIPPLTRTTVLKSHTLLPNHRFLFQEPRWQDSSTG